MSPSNLFLFPVYVCRYSECTIYIPGAAETFYHLCPQHITIGLSLRCCTECTLHSHEEGDHHSNAARFGQRPCQGSEGGSFSERGRVGDGGRREQGHAAADRRRRGRGQADEEAEEGGRGGRHPGAADSAGHGQYQQRAGTGQQYRRHAVRVPAARRHSRPERARRQPHRVPVRRRRRRAVAGRARQAAGGRLLPPPDPGPGILPPAVVADGWARRIRVRLRGGQQLRARGGAQPPRELLADDRAARPPGQCRRAARARWRRRAQLLLDIIARFFHLPFFFASFAVLLFINGR